MFFKGSVEKASSWRWMKLRTRRRCSVGVGPGCRHPSPKGPPGALHPRLAKAHPHSLGTGLT